MDSIKIKNLHSLVDTGEFLLKPINILVGANSSGKSSFLRTFPLLKQGLNTNKKGPILWLSEDVDFGDFKKAVRRGEKEIEFEFNISRYKIGLRIKDANNQDYIDYIKISFKDQKIEISLDLKGTIEYIRINDEELLSKENTIKNYQTRGSILPVFLIERSFQALSIDGEEIQSRIVDRGMNLDASLVQYLNTILNNQLVFNTVQSIKEKISPRGVSRSRILELCKSIDKPKTWSRLVEGWTIDNDVFMGLNNRIVLSHSFRILRILNFQITRFLLNTNYIGPVRATAERYYRRQNLSLDFIDPKGFNLPMLINDLSNNETKELKDWLETNFGFSVKTENSGGHISVFLVNSNTEESYNLADSGFGFSQILPIIVSLWFYTSKRRSRRLEYTGRTRFLVIEQPELHLHPAFQASLADAFIKTVLIAKEHDCMSSN